MLTAYAVSAFGWSLLGLAFVVIWIALAFWPARVARRKGHSFIGYFIFSLFFFPLALIMAYLVHDRRQPAY
jgi:pilus assembly protein TadC